MVCDEGVVFGNALKTSVVGETDKLAWP